MWTALIVPPLATLIATLGMAFIPGFPDATRFNLALTIPPVVLILILGLLAHFQKTIYQRFRGRATDYLCVAYFLGEIIVCLTLWLGNFMLFYKVSMP